MPAVRPNKLDDNSSVEKDTNGMMSQVYSMYLSKSPSKILCLIHAPLSIVYILKCSLNVEIYDG